MTALAERFAFPGITTWAVFGSGTLDRVGDEVERLGRRRPDGDPNHLRRLRDDRHLGRDREGPLMLVKGRTLTPDGNPIANAKLDVWQANDEDVYDVQQRGI